MQSILIIEDNIDTLNWLKECVQSAFNPKLINTAESIADVKPLVKNKYDLALVDLHLPDGSGVEALQMINQHHAQTVCVVATIFDDDEHLFPALQAGATGYLLKDLSTEDFVSSLIGIIEGKPPLSPAIARRLMSHFAQPNTAEAIKISPREQEVLQLIAKGLQVKKIALELSISPYTVSDYIKSLYEKLSINSRAEAAVEAVKRGLI